MRIKHLFFTVIFIASLSTFAQLDTKFEAESSALTGTYEIKNNANASDGQFVKMDNPSTLSFSVNISDAGNYKLNVYTFNGGVTQDITLEINGSSSTVTLQPSNWAFEGTAKATSLDVTLIAGNNTIKFIRAGVNVLMDYFSVTTPTISSGKACRSSRHVQRESIRLPFPSSSLR